MSNPAEDKKKRVCHKSMAHPFLLFQERKSAGVTFFEAPRYLGAFSPSSAAIFTPIARGGGDRCLRNHTSATSEADGNASELALHTAPSD